jgi:hypothetical protein
MKFLSSALLALVFVPVESTLGQESTLDRRALESSTSGLEKTVAAQNSDPQDILSGFKSYYIKSDTIYLHPDTLLRELQKRGEFSAWELTATEDSKAADVVITITMPFLTWEWNYRMVYEPTGTVLGTGKVSAAVEKTAVPQLAAMIVKRIREARPLPTSFREIVETQQALANSSPEKGKSWKVRYMSGPASGIAKDTPVTLTLNREWMTVRNSKTLVFCAPVSNLSALDSRTEMHKATKGWEDFWDASFDRYMQAGDGKVQTAAPMGIAFPFIFAGALPVALVGEGVLAPIKITDHFVSVYWLEDGAVKRAEFRATTGDAKSLLAELNRVTGREVEDLQQLSQERLKVIAKRFDASPIVENDRQVSVGWRKLAPGAYRLVVVTREKNLAEVYFFPANFHGGSFDANDVAAHAVVEFDRRKTSVENKAASSVSYREQKGTVMLDQIETSELILRFTPIPFGLGK